MPVVCVGGLVVVRRVVHLLNCALQSTHTHDTKHTHAKPRTVLNLRRPPRIVVQDNVGSVGHGLGALVVVSVGTVGVVLDLDILCDDLFWGGGIMWSV